MDFADFIEKSTRDNRLFDRFRVILLRGSSTELHDFFCAEGVNMSLEKCKVLIEHKAKQVVAPASPY